MLGDIFSIYSIVLRNHNLEIKKGEGLISPGSARCEQSGSSAAFSKRCVGFVFC